MRIFSPGNSNMISIVGWKLGQSLSYCSNISGSLWSNQNCSIWQWYKYFIWASQNQNFLIPYYVSLLVWVSWCEKLEYFNLFIILNVLQRPAPAVKIKGWLLLGLRQFYERSYGLISDTVPLQYLTLYYTNLCAYASCQLDFVCLLYGAFLLS